MIEVSATTFAKNPIHFQLLAKKEPVIVSNGEQKQVLLDYDHYQQLTDKPFVSLYDAIYANMSPELRQALAQMSDDELE